MHFSMHDLSIRNSEIPSWIKIETDDPGWIYMLVCGDLLKVGKTTNPRKRLREACTWLPNASLGALKPFWGIKRIELDILSGFADYWIGGEWHKFDSERQLSSTVSDFRSFFDNHDMSFNSVDFLAWIGCSGIYNQMVEHTNRNLSLRKWQLQAKNIMSERKQRRACINLDK